MNVPSLTILTLSKPKSAKSLRRADLSDEGKKITIGHQEPLLANTDDDFEDGEAVGEW
jgi:hypothetical protein